MALIDDMKKALRISHNKLDSDITICIDTAKAEMKRLGILETKINSDDKLINMAIRTYVQMQYATDTKQAEGYEKSWLYQIDCLRKTSSYTEADNV